MDLQLLNIFSKITPRSQATGGKATNKGKQMSKLITDAELIAVMTGTNSNGKKHFMAVYEGNKAYQFKADTKAEAENFAKEYGIRILNLKLRFLASSAVEELFF
jgi:hypothetical protein